MNIIKKLDQDLINKIAAGEVVERPASVIKELIENSIDAKANQISIELKNGGIDLISIQDNGLGMSKDDAILAIERHATSKISSLEDLFNIQTMGFRGEALASISAVSQFTMETKTKNSAEGAKLEIIDSKLKINACGCPDGTKIIIKDLFYNVPARKKFLKSPATEYNHILELFIQLALINPQISFKLIHNNKLTHNLPKTTNWLERIKQVLGSDIAKQLIPVKNQGTIEISGFIGKPQIARNNRLSQYVFINQRAVNDFLITKAVKEAYNTLISKELYPTVILNINLPGALVDVNVHPRKTEVKFNNSQEVFVTVLQACQKALTNNISQNIILDGSGPVKKFTLKNQTTSESYRPSVSYQPNLKSITPNPSQISQALEFSKQILDNEFTAQTKPRQINDWRLLGQIHHSYLLVESNQGLLIIDQHAAAERILYEQYKKYYQQAGNKSQKLLLPITLELSGREVATLNQSLEFLNNLGFEIEIFGNNSFIVNSVPQELGKLDIQQTVLGIIDDLDNNDFGKLKSIEEKKDMVIKYAACRTAVKFKDKLEPEEQIKLLEDIYAIKERINTCPHGRPFIMELSLNQLAKNFKRL